MKLRRSHVFALLALVGGGFLFSTYNLMSSLEDQSRTISTLHEQLESSHARLNLLKNAVRHDIERHHADAAKASHVDLKALKALHALETQPDQGRLAGRGHSRAALTTNKQGMPMWGASKVAQGTDWAREHLADLVPWGKSGAGEENAASGEGGHGGAVAEAWSRLDARNKARLQRTQQAAKNTMDLMEDDLPDELRQFLKVLKAADKTSSAAGTSQQPARGSASASRDRRRVPARVHVRDGPAKQRGMDLFGDDDDLASNSDPVPQPAPRGEAAIAEFVRNAKFPIRNQSEPLYVVWDFGAGGCAGFALEAINMVIPFNDPKRGVEMGLIVGNDFCDGLPDWKLEILENMRTKDIASWDIDIFVSHKPSDGYPTFPYKGLVRLAKPPKYLIGRSMIEVDRIHSSWARHVHTKANEVWVPAEFLIPAFEHAGVDRRKLWKLPESMDFGMYDMSIDPYPVRDRAGFNFLSMFKWEARKNWEGLLRAYFSEFKRHDDVTLHIQTYLYLHSNPHKASKVYDIIFDAAEQWGYNISTLPVVNVMAEIMPTVDMPRLYRACDAFVLPTRGEGWGLPIMEAMGMGLPTIATNWSGQTEFMTPDTSYLIPVEAMVNATGREYQEGQQWAEPSFSELRRLMRFVFENRDEAKEVGKRARAHVMRNFNVDVIADKIEARFREIGRTLPASPKRTPKPPRRVAHTSGKSTGNSSDSEAAAEAAAMLHLTEEELQEREHIKYAKEQFQKQRKREARNLSKMKKRNKQGEDVSYAERLVAREEEAKARVRRKIQAQQRKEERKKKAMERKVKENEEKRREIEADIAGAQDATSGDGDAPASDAPHRAAPRQSLADRARVKEAQQQAAAAAAASADSAEAAPKPRKARLRNLIDQDHP